MYSVKYSYQGVMPDGSVTTWLCEVPDPTGELAGPPGVTDVLQTNYPQDFGYQGPTGPTGQTGPADAGFSELDLYLGSPAYTWDTRSYGTGDLTGSAARVWISGALVRLDISLVGAPLGKVIELTVEPGVQGELQVYILDGQHIVNITRSGLYRFVRNVVGWALLAAPATPGFASLPARETDVTWGLSGTGLDAVGRCLYLHANGNITLTLSEASDSGAVAGEDLWLDLYNPLEYVVTINSGSTLIVSDVLASGRRHYVFDGAHWRDWT